MLNRTRFSTAFMLFVTTSVGCGVFTRDANAQTTFVDDAHRAVTVPEKLSRSFAAGAPAEVLLYTLAPESMVGRNHLPSATALEFMPPALQNPVAISKLPRSQDARDDAELLALKPDIYVDYGDLHEDYVNSVQHVQERTGIPGIIMDGALENIPTVYRKLGALLNVKQRGETLAKATERLLRKYRGALKKTGKPPRVYLACSFDAVIPCLAGERNGEVAEFLGAINVAGDTNTSPKRPITVEEIKNWNPEVIIAASKEAALKMERDIAWQSVAVVNSHRVYAAPTLPFNWGSRPPSVNRLPGMIWLAYVLSGRDFDATFYSEIRSFYKLFYHFEPTDEQLTQLVSNK